jgi:hypothetical protein
MIKLDMCILLFRISCFVSGLESTPFRGSIHLRKIDGFKEHEKSRRRSLGKSRAVSVDLLGWDQIILLLTYIETPLII